LLRRSRLLQLIAAAPAALATTPLAARAQALQPLRIVLFPGETSATAYYAKELGYFARAGIDPQITEVSNGSAAAAAVAGGSMDVGFSNPLSVAQGHLRGLPFTALLAAALSRRNAPPSNGLVVVAKSSPIKTAKDLNGKVFAVDVLGGLPHVSVRTWIDKNGGDSSSVHFVEMAFAQMQSALDSGRVDASEMNMAFDPNLGKPNDALRLLGNSYDAVGQLFCSSCWFSTDDWVKNNPALAAKFVATMRDAAMWANAHHAESAVMLAPHIKETVAQIVVSTRVTYGTDISPGLIQPVIDAAARYGMLKAAFPAAEMVAVLK
jgi:NitT/TauT family transport system substrate-binding protein